MKLVYQIGIWLVVVAGMSGAHAENLNLSIVGKGEVLISSQEDSCTDDCVLNYPKNALITLEHNASENWEFSHWDDNLCIQDEIGYFSGTENLFPVTEQSLGAKSIIINDFNNDGQNDVVTNWLFSKKVEILYNNGNGFDTPVLIGNQFNYNSALTAVDWDKDGSLDIVVTDFGAKTITIFGNKGLDGFEKIETLVFEDISPYAVVVHDINSDGEYDLLISSFEADYSSDLGRLEATITDAQLRWYINQDDTFVADKLISEGEGIITLDSGDVDGDGDLDIAAASITTYSSFIFKNNGDTYETQLARKGYGTYGVALGYVNSDSKLDLITTDYWKGALILNIQMEDGTFSADQKIGVHFDGVTATAIGDLDGDGLNDIATSVFNEQDFRWYKNEAFDICHFYLAQDYDVTATFTSDTETETETETEEDDQPEKDSKSGGVFSIYFLVGLLVSRIYLKR
ncbi:VCBS repeat-containing protein [Psychrosphaera sp. 1_MG-2023]|uniref:FG-GAP repeat domain-containing protein n=1 Tax=Psychrosphaera sp. 1_MG-2023 TaxID=3062643 RepID=UPI0026E30277|nr:VCBS repeat-containing protein [Psychrosphaera sp. 1_MG-2023]MDO6719412.1 VCBS repeat-containing protein [Psychrosphaera sp. 1_MG-2023]